MGGLVIAVAFALLSGDPRDFFLPGIYIDAAYALALATSVVVGHPLIGHGYAFLVGRDDSWRRDRRLRRVFAMTTLGWSAISAVRAAVQAGFYRADLTELLTLARGAPGWQRPTTQSRRGDDRSHSSVVGGPGNPERKTTAPGQITASP